ncbi:hypothetical protein LJC08_05670 [Methanimicrococcus sp. OttesenSCG-928-J09]|nr:hypothetical protein [Methanimicrococcus sp. OttesenSCG-928-J09]
MNYLRIISVLFILIVFSSVSGCIEIADQNTNEAPYTYARIKCYQYEDDLICRVSYTVYGGNYIVDEENVTSKVVGNDVKINLPLIKEEKKNGGGPYNPNGAIAVNIGPKSSFNMEETYTVYMDENTEIGSFNYENGTLACFTPIHIDGIRINVVDNQIKATVKVWTGVSSVYTVDVDNATINDTLTENNLYTISLAEKEKFTTEIEAIPLMAEISVHTFDIANTKDLEDGKYKVMINDKEVSFIVKNNHVIRIYNTDNLWLPPKTD